MTTTTTADELREQVREHYAASARAVTDGDGRGCGCSTIGYTAEELARAAGRGGARRRSAAAIRPRWPSCMRARSCSTSAPAAGST